MSTASPQKTITPQELLRRLGNDQNLILLDVREKDEWLRGHIESAIHMPMNEVLLRMNELPDTLTIVCYCHSGQRSALVQDLLQRSDFEHVYNLKGGIVAWGQVPGARIVTG